MQLNTVANTHFFVVVVVVLFRDRKTLALTENDDDGDDADESKAIISKEIYLYGMSIKEKCMAKNRNDFAVAVVDRRLCCRRRQVLFLRNFSTSFPCHLHHVCDNRVHI